MPKATFEIEWDGDAGESWMNIWNLIICLTSTCPNTTFIVRGTNSIGEPIETTNRSALTEPLEESK